ncbi:MAG: polysaccharide deacetylase family protein, partial [Bacillota bacterium]|nr:polysaccharide deacetylase family protein [Bacillota bacterium]
MSKKVGTLVFAFFLFVLIFEIRYYIAGLTAKKVSGYSPPLTMATLGSSMKPSAMNHPNVVPPKAVPILYYHSVKLEAGNELRMPPDQFEEQMTYLKDNGFESITLEQFYQAQNFGGALPKKPFVITFDDGYADNYTTAFPILKKHGFTAGVFMV